MTWGRAPTFVSPLHPLVQLYRRRTSQKRTPRSSNGSRAAFSQPSGADVQNLRTAQLRNQSLLSHCPVLLAEVLHHLPERCETVIDCTLGGGGHAAAILSERREIRRYIGIDKDDVALRLAREVLREHEDVVKFVRGDFRDVRTLAASHGVGRRGADAVLLDLGVSSMQLDDAARGFSFMRDGPLDMRMAHAGGMTAADVVNGLAEDELATLLFTLGEERDSRRVARAIVRRRDSHGVYSTTGELARTVADVKGWRKRGAHPATKVFQAIRIAVNGELDALQDGLRAGVDVLADAGRLNVISFHSLEDRIVKNMFKEHSLIAGGVKLVTKKPIVPDDEEQARNVRSRSAKLRVAERLPEGVLPQVGKVNKYAKRSVDDNVGRGTAA